MEHPLSICESSQSTQRRWSYHTHSAQYAVYALFKMSSSDFLEVTDNSDEDLDRLRARIEQQSELISLMKKRSDGLIKEVSLETLSFLYPVLYIYLNCFTTCYF